MDQPTPQSPYTDTPSTQTIPSPSSQTHSRSPSIQSSTIKPLPALPVEAPTYHNDAPYRDEPPTPAPTSQTSSTDVAAPQYSPQYARQQRYTDATPLPTPDPDDVPLAHFLLHQHQVHTQTAYPHDAPPSYTDVVLAQHYSRSNPPSHISIPPPNHQGHIPLLSPTYAAQHAQYWRYTRGPIALTTDEEAVLIAGEAPDDVRYSVERIVAMLVVAVMLLVLSAVLGWLALGSGVW